MPPVALPALTDTFTAAGADVGAADGEDAEEAEGAGGDGVAEASDVDGDGGAEAGLDAGAVDADALTATEVEPAATDTPAP